ncbi:hypothetical protein M413DRAFT_31363 [Hebeloma cylindrosporum]|uniref:Uncharacterized protein n=1 Tax=Hebeloma cylindrosporum TaxID=76867 RepID=A0A0C2Y6S3_HEBCY|nr:hypothetical protein M413DRAFT_31363 [Hebeloma cylindrosporum h7]
MAEEFWPRDNRRSGSDGICTSIACIPCRESEYLPLEDQIRDFFFDEASTVPVDECLINRMPFEILSQIFFFSLPESFFDYSDFESTPLLLGAVCLMWRDVAWSTPQLWNRMKIQLTPRSLRSKVKVACGWLNRSGRLPLFIRISVRSPDLYDPVFTHSIPSDPDTARLNKYSNHFYPLASAINEYSDRLYHLDLDGFSHWSFSNLSSPRVSSMLHTLKLGCNVGGSRNYSAIAFCPEGKVFAPSFVKIYHIPFSSIGINWANVTQLEVERFCANECFQVVRRAPLLVHCTFLDVVSNPGSSSSYSNPGGQRFPHLHLKELVVRPRESGIDTFFNRLSIPSLESLDIGVKREYYEASIPVDAIIGFLACSPLLHHMEIFHPRFESGEELVQICEATPCLTMLVIGFGWIWHDQYHRKWEPDLDAIHLLLIRLSETWLVTNNHVNFLPKLQKFVFEGPWPQIPCLDMLPEAFGPISEIGNPLRRPLRFLDIDFRIAHSQQDGEEDDVDRETMDRLRRGETADRLQQLRDNGIKILLDLSFF